MLCARLLINCNSRSGSRLRHSKMFDARTVRRSAPTGSNSWFTRRRHCCWTCCSFCSDHSFCCGKLPGALAFSSCALILLGLVLAGLSSGTDSCSVLAMGDSRLLGAVNECVARNVPWVIPGRGHLFVGCRPGRVASEWLRLLQGGDLIERFWQDSYLGTPDHLRVDWAPLSKATCHRERSWPE